VEITEVKIFLVGEEKLKAFVSIVLDRCFMINDIKVIQGREGLFISMPSRRKKNGEFKDVAHPLNNDTRSWMEDRILREYEQQLFLRGQGLHEGRPVVLDGGQPAVETAATEGSGVGPSVAGVDRGSLSEAPWSTGWQRAAIRSR
jgi:stage V sporulation protein G